MTTTSHTDRPTAPTVTAFDPASPDDPTITPSELVWLGAEVFFDPPPSIAFGKYVALAEGGALVSLERFVRVAFAAALLEAERAGVVRLVTSSTPKWFGLRRVPSLTVEPASRAVDWPADSLEAAVVACLAERGPLSVSDLVFHLVPEDGASVRQGIADRVAAGLATRGYVVETEGSDVTAENGDTGEAVDRHEADTGDERGGEMRRWRVTDVTQTALSTTLVGPLSELWGRLNDVYDHRPDVWELLGDGVDDGVNRRYESGPDFYTRTHMSH